MRGAALLFRVAAEFDATAPTIGAAIRQYLALHPGDVDDV